MGKFLALVMSSLEYLGRSGKIRSGSRQVRQERSDPRAACRAA